MKQLVKFLLLTLGIIFVVCVSFFGYHAGRKFLFGSSHATGLGYRRVLNIVEIRIALMQYKHQNGNYPDRLSDLFPDYITSDNIKILYGPSVGVNEYWIEKRTSFIDAQEHFDKNLAYCYFGNNRDITLCEKPGIWEKDKQIDPDILCILFPDGSVKPCNVSVRKRIGVEGLLNERLKSLALQL